MKPKAKARKRNPIVSPSHRHPSACTTHQDRLYYVSVRSKPVEELGKKAHFFTMDSELVYWNFFLDFGPLNLAQLYRFCQRLNTKLKAESLRDKVIYYYCGSHAHKRTNAAFLIAAWAVLYLDRTPEEAFRPFRNVYPPFPPFHDASPCVCTYNLSIIDCLKVTNVKKKSCDHPSVYSSIQFSHDRASAAPTLPTTPFSSKCAPNTQPNPTTQNRAWPRPATSASSTSRASTRRSTSTSSRWRTGT